MPATAIVVTGTYETFKAMNFAFRSRLWYLKDSDPSRAAFVCAPVSPLLLTALDITRREYEPVPAPEFRDIERKHVRPRRNSSPARSRVPIRGDLVRMNELRAKADNAFFLPPPCAAAGTATQRHITHLRNGISHTPVNAARPFFATYIYYSSDLMVVRRVRDEDLEMVKAGDPAKHLLRKLEEPPSKADVPVVLRKLPPDASRQIRPRGQ
ncbi:hypothetical protein [Tahibacter amnicola]|uniref:Uncharacterized protein n=1 Tax=Tahibacter amnicola TaxID=2976241 RepID=A0ABY6BH63_9GAMM|nr:hypothetical protein [Tahibacter amnicola]UXI67946.1 hypothetical protein N4264_25000 [Tahibacter amnicola]